MSNEPQGGIVDKLPPTTDEEYDALLSMNGAYTPQMKAKADEIIARKVAAIRAEHERQGTVSPGGSLRGVSYIEENVIPISYITRRIR